MKSPQVEALEKHFKRPFFNIADYGFLYSPPTYPPQSDGERLMDREYRKCYQLNEAGEIIALNLTECRCSNEDTAFLEQLDSLQSLNLGGNKISDGNFLSSLNSIQSLDLSYNKISDGNFLSSLNSLQSLNLGGNNISDGNFLSSLNSLQSLDLFSNNISDGNFLSSLNSLQSLDLGYNNISDWNFLSSLNSLQSLDLNSNNISDGNFLSSLNSIQSLDLGGNKISDGNFLSSLNSLQSLNLGGNKISDGNFLSSLNSLQSLNLNSNNISDGNFLSSLNSIQSLDLYSNKISDGNFLSSLNSIQSLDLGGNNISDWNFLSSLNSLQSLNLGGNNISDWNFLSSLNSLQSLNLSYNNISDGNFLSSLNSLQSLNLSYNNISDGNFLSSLNSLQSLNLNSNNISDGNFLFSLAKLRTVDLRENQLKDLPEFLLKTDIEIEEGHEYRSALPGSLNWRSNPIESPSIEILRQGHEAIVNYFSAGEMQALREAKVLVVGEAEVGKTSLIKQLLGQEFDPKERKTHEIGRHPLTLTCGDKGTINLRVWDFGGQDIMHATHQFFLTRRSVYLLVLNSRHNENQSRIDYWLRLIESFGGDSPVIVVCNKSDEEIMNLPWKAYLEKFPRIRHYVKRVSCSDGDGMKEVLDRIAQVVEEDLPHVGEPVPKTWFAVKEALEAQTESGKDYLDRSSFENLCEDKGVKKDAEGTLLRFLHDLGVVLHFDDAHPMFKKGGHEMDTKVLNPAWVTAAIYRVINNPDLITAGGHLHLTDLQRILNEVPDFTYDEPQQEFIVGMMKRFELCFELTDQAGKAWLLPDLLPKDSPEIGNWKGAWRFRFQYSILPGAVISRLIVRLHHLIQGEFYWRYGAVLEWEEHEARIRADLQDGVLEIALRGKGPEESLENRRAFLALIWAELKKIHQGFSDQFDAREWVESNQNRNVFKPLATLEKMEKAGHTEIWLDEVEDMRPLEDFLSNVTDESRSSPEAIIQTARKSRAAVWLELLSVELSNIRCFENLTLNFAKNVEDASAPAEHWVAILGDNATGKSTILRCIALGLCGESHASGLLSDLPGDLIRSGSQEGTIVVRLQDRSTKESFTITTKLEKGKDTRGSGPEVIRQETSPAENFPWKRIFFSGYGTQRALPSDESHEGYSPLNAVATLFDPKARLMNPEVVFLRQNKSVQEKLARQISKILMLDSEKEAAVSSQEKGMIVRGGWGSLPLESLSDGYRSTIHWVLDLMGWSILAGQEELGTAGGIVLIDELEQHLHPRWQRYIVERIRKQFPETQFIITTHTALVASGVIDLESAAIVSLSENEESQGVKATVLDRDRLKGLRADQVLASEAFGLMTSLSVESVKAKIRYRELWKKAEDRTPAEETEFKELQSQIKAGNSKGESAEDRELQSAFEEFYKERIESNLNHPEQMNWDVINELLDFE